MAEKEQSSGFAISSEEIERLRQTIVKLEAENAQLTAEYQDELDAQRVELLELQQAYDQFEQASDLVLNDLEQKNERLRDESRYHSKRSML
jgi:predicted NUDIX family phosphoesterase